MIVLEGRESDLAPSVWARGGQAPLRVQTSPLTGDVRQSGDSRGSACGPKLGQALAARRDGRPCLRSGRRRVDPHRPAGHRPALPPVQHLPGVAPYWSLNTLWSHGTMLSPAEGFLSGSQACPSAS
jgi:hypothetical protein